MKQKWMSPLLLFGLVLLGPMCLDASAAEGGAKGADTASGKLVITGSSTLAPMIEEIGKRFKALHPGVQIEVQAGGTGRGISDAMAGRVDIGMASRALKDNESALYSFAIARDGICLIVHKGNPVQSLSNRQVADIYTGKITNWSQVGGRDAPILVINPKEGFGSVDLFSHFFDIKYSDIKAQAVVGDNFERFKAIVDDPNGITYVSLGTAERQVAARVPIKLLPADGVAATTKNIRSGNFPISRPLLLLTKEPPAGVVKEFINFSLSSQVTDIVAQYDFVPYLD